MDRHAASTNPSFESLSGQVTVDWEHVEKARDAIRWRRRYRWPLLAVYSGVAVAVVYLVEQLRLMAADGLNGPQPDSSLWGMIGLVIGFKLGAIMTSAVYFVLDLFRTKRDLLICQLYDALQSRQK